MAGWTVLLIFLRWEGALNYLIAHGQRIGDVPAVIAPDREAAFLLAAAEGLQASMLLGQRSAAS